MSKHNFHFNGKVTQLQMETGLVTVSIDLGNDLIVLSNTSPLVSALSVLECEQLQQRLQNTLNFWCDEKGIAHS